MTGAMTGAIDQKSSRREASPASKKSIAVSVLTRVRQANMIGATQNLQRQGYRKMAEPPNALTLAVFPGTDPARIYDALVARRCLTASALADRGGALRVIEEAAADFNNQTAPEGPTFWYAVLNSMSEAGLLNRLARERRAALRTSRNPRARVRYFLQELWWRLRY